MITKLFDIQNNKIIPTEHCYSIKWLKDIMDNYSKDEEYLKVYAYLFYMTCPNPDTNPYFNVIEADKEELILEDVDIEVSTEDPLIRLALDKCEKLYETPTSRAYMGIKKALDNIAIYMANTTITDGRDGNISQIRAVAKDFDSIRQSYKGAFRDLQDEQSSRVRGGKGLAYDQG
tara:strand:- start:4183 stop:4707 length:525 start_codon:yes stop_codon:yes gene_type:complete